jgi:beta-glucanase (GH16 family)
MKYKSLIVLFSPVLMTACLTQSPQIQPTITPEWHRNGWELVWHDEFDGETINPENWLFNTGDSGWGNNEWQYYTDRPENARVEDGMLIIEARQENYLGSDYTSARMITQYLHSWTYGRVEARMKLPTGQGVWPAFWMLGDDIDQVSWPKCGEIDIMENIGDPNIIYNTLHGPGYSGGNGVGGSHVFSGVGLNEDYHIYALEWKPIEIRWYFDDNLTLILTPDNVPGEWVFDHPFFILLNLAIGGNWPGYPDESTVFPQRLYVDYVRVYRESNFSVEEDKE